PNAPNPFYPRTQIRYESDGVMVGPIGMTIHDVTGRRVRDLGLVAATTGVHRVNWDGRDDGGRDLPSGIYLVRLETAHHLVRSQRILLTR
ncbi:MAG: T9SS type A sorting domain-containing protein, partial [Candidatus Eisenbacteria bacterium]|nr:T9SS type A sorting domain-containing protein [Candidatus Eisenbacteria bacterium]